MTKVLVTGGTGTLGQLLVPRLASDSSVRVLTRQRRRSEPGIRYVTGDLSNGNGLMEAAHAVDVIVHCASDFRRTKTDVEGTRRLLQAAGHSGAKPHVIYISIVGVDRHPYKYYGAKRAAEETIEASGLPWTTLRTTQWYELVDYVLSRMTRAGLTFVPKDLSFQPLAASEVAARLVRLVSAKPSGLLPDMAGPSVRTVDDLATAWSAAQGIKTRLVHVPVLGKTGAAFREGVHLNPDRAVGRTTWESWLKKNLRPKEENEVNDLA